MRIWRGHAEHHPLPKPGRAEHPSLAGSAVRATAHPSTSEDPDWNLFRTLVSKQPVPLVAAELPAPLPQPCQQPGCSQRFQAFGPDGSQKEAAVCQSPAAGSRAAACAKPGSRGGEQTPANLSDRSPQDRRGLWMPIFAEHEPDAFWCLL